MKIGSRASKLALAQVQEVMKELPHIPFEIVAVHTTGDKDLSRSLRTLDKTDFFTKEVDELLLNGSCRIAIHSAKDLPEPLPKGLQVVALTQGVDPSDSLVFKTLPTGALVATSSVRREQAVSLLRSDLKFCDIRGTVDERLQQLESGKIQGVVIAEAALIRLQLTHLNRIRLPGTTTPLQGQLAIMSRSGDLEMEKLFQPLDVRKKSLYLGPELPKRNFQDRRLTHHPLIKIIPKPIPNAAYQALFKSTHIIFTSKSAVRVFAEEFPFLKKTYLALGEATADVLREYGVSPTIASIEQAEGIVTLLQELKPDYVFYPHSALSRPVIQDALLNIPHFAFELYDTLPTETPLPELSAFDEIIFSSPSTVEAFFAKTSTLPHLTYTPIGPITEQALAKYIPINQNGSKTGGNYGPKI